MRLLIIEDSRRLRESLEKGFTRAGFAVDAVEDGRRGLTFAKRETYDVVLLDLRLPEMDGLDVLSELRASGSETHVLILTARGSVEERVRGLRLGADDYVAKPFAFEELLARVEALVRRRYKSKNALIEIESLTIDTTLKRATFLGTELGLAKREFKVLEYLARRMGETVSRLEIEDHIYTEAMLPESNAVESAISTIRRKLKDCGAEPKDLLRTRHGMGYCLGGA